MNDEQISDKVIKLVENILNDENINSQSSQDNTASWDSMAYLSILDKIEEEYNLDINQDNFNNFGSISQICNEIRKCQDSTP